MDRGWIVQIRNRVRDVWWRINNLFDYPKNNLAKYQIRVKFKKKERKNILYIEKIQLNLTLSRLKKTNNMRFYLKNLIMIYILTLWLPKILWKLNNWLKLKILIKKLVQQTKYFCKGSNVGKVLGFKKIKKEYLKLKYIHSLAIPIKNWRIKMNIIHLISFKSEIII